MRGKIVVCIIVLVIIPIFSFKLYEYLSGPRNAFVKLWLAKYSCNYAGCPTDDPFFFHLSEAAIKRTQLDILPDLKIGDSYRGRIMLSDPTHLGGFLLHRAALLRRLSTGCNAMPSRQNIDCADDIGVVFISAFNTQKPLLCPAIGSTDTAALWADSTSILWCDSNEDTTAPGQLVCELPAKFGPALIQNGFIQPGLRLNISPRIFDASCRRSAHITHLQILNTHHRVVFAYGGCGLMQKIPTAVTYTGMDALHAQLCLLPIVTELYLTTHCPLVTTQTSFMTFETVERVKTSTVAESRKLFNTNINTHGSCCLGRCRLFDFPFRLDTDKPPAAG